MFRIGLTGGIATGKSTVVKIMQEFGVSVINLDQISREILTKGSEGYWQVLEIFGQEILDSSENINRKKLGKIVFNNVEKRNVLEAITHPLILKKMDEKIDFLKSVGEKVVVVEVPLLIETGMMDQFDQVWLVYIDKAIQKKRLKERDFLSENEILQRINAQMPLEEKKKYADFIIDNSSNRDELKEKLRKIWREIECRELL